MSSKARKYTSLGAAMITVMMDRPLSRYDPKRVTIKRINGVWITTSYSGE